MSLDLNKEMALYADFMAEIKGRMRAINDMLATLAADPKQKDGNILAESVILQTRLICELVALSSLAAHSKFGLTPDLYKSWHAQKTFRLLEQINPNCFPRPGVINRSENGVHIADKPNQITQTDLAKIYHQCGAMLHRGVIEHALKDKPRIYDLVKVAKWLHDIKELMETHVILLLAHNAALVVQMHASPKGDVQVFAVETDGPSALVDSARK